MSHISAGTPEIAKVAEQKLLRKVDLWGVAASPTLNSTKKKFVTVTDFR